MLYFYETCLWRGIKTDFPIPRYLFRLHYRVLAIKFTCRLFYCTFSSHLLSLSPSRVALSCQDLHAQSSCFSERFVQQPSPLKPACFYHLNLSYFFFVFSGCFFRWFIFISSTITHTILVIFRSLFYYIILDCLVFCNQTHLGCKRRRVLFITFIMFSSLRCRLHTALSDFTFITY